MRLCETGVNRHPGGVPLPYLLQSGVEKRSIRNQVNDLQSLFDTSEEYRHPFEVIAFCYGLWGAALLRLFDQLASGDRTS